MGNLSCPILPVFGDISFPPSNLHGYNDFGIKYDEQNAEHLVAEIKENYKISEDWTSNLYCDISLDLQYEGKWYLNTSFNNYVHKDVTRCKHKKRTKHQDCPFKLAPRKYGTTS